MTNPPDITADILVELANITSELGHLSHVLAVGLAVVEAQEAPPAPATPPDRLPWSYWGPELRTRLKDLAGRFPAQAIADCAAELAELIAEHGPKADEVITQLEAAERRRR